MADIEINLGETFYAPALHISLLDMLRAGGFYWPEGATCVTQECDGALLWWSAPVNEVRQARKDANHDDGLMPLLGLGQQVSVEYYDVGEQAFVANNWEEAVVTFAQFTKAN